MYHEELEDVMRQKRKDDVVMGLVDDHADLEVEEPGYEEMRNQGGF